MHPGARATWLDAAKRTLGRKRVAMVDADGNWLAIAVVPASVQEPVQVPVKHAGAVLRCICTPLIARRFRTRKRADWHKQFAGADAMTIISTIEVFQVPPRWLFVRVETRNGAVGWGEASLEGHAKSRDRSVRGASRKVRRP